MERVITVHLEKLPEGLYLATSDDVQRLVAQGRTVTETLEIARDVARKLIEAQEQRNAARQLQAVGQSFDYPLIVSTL
jgi:predicted RNase H-like HicB family nuclease